MTTDEEKDLCEFGIEHEKCYFCGQPRTIQFEDHYTFCPNCSAIYTNMMLLRSGCDHITENTPCVLNEPWYKSDRQKPYMVETIEDTKICSICGAKCESDGW